MGNCLTGGKKKNPKTYNPKKDDEDALEIFKNTQTMISKLKAEIKISDSPISQILGKETPTVIALNTEKNFVVIQSGCTPLGFEDNEESYMFGPERKSKKNLNYLFSKVQ